MITIIVEDGTGLEDANSYVDTQFVINYEETLGKASFNAASEHEQNVALVQASRFIDMRYRKRMLSDKLNVNQGLQLPREDISITNSFKNAVAHATVMYIEQGLDLNANKNNAIRRQSTGIGSGAIQETVEYFYPLPDNAFSVIDSLMFDALPTSSSSLQFNVHRG